MTRRSEGLQRKIYSGEATVLHIDPTVGLVVRCEVTVVVEPFLGAIECVNRQPERAFVRASSFLVEVIR